MSKVWATSEDGTIEYVSLTNKYLQETISLLKRYFFPYSNMFIAHGIENKKDAIEVTHDLLIDIAKDGISIIAVDKSTGKLAGVAMNQIQSKFTEVQKQFKESKVPEQRHIFQIFHEMGKHFDPYEYYNVDYLMEVIFLCVAPEYSGRGIGTKLSEVSLELATKLHKGENVKTSLDDTMDLPLEPIPHVMSLVCITFKSQKICRKLQLDVMQKVSFEDLSYNGRSLASKITDGTKYITREFIKLE